MATRKKRTDRNHVIYNIICEPTQESYIGVTVMLKQAVKKTLNSRLNQHLYKATVVQPNWTLSKAIRKHGIESFSIHPIQVVRGRLNAFKRESELINLHNPILNTKMKR